MATVTGYDGTPRVEDATYETGIRVKYLGPTNYRGSRFIVTNLRTGKRRTVSHNYGASCDPARDAAGRAFDVQPTDISRIGYTSDGSDYYLARLPLSD